MRSLFPFASRALIFFLLFGFCGSLRAQDVLILKDEEPEPGETNTQEKNEEAFEGTAEAGSQPFLIFYEKWRDFERALNEGRGSDADRAMNDLIAMRKRAEIPKITELAIGAVHLGDLQLVRNDSAGALKLYRAAAMLDPSLSYAYYSESRAHLARGVSGLIPATLAAIRGFFAPKASVEGAIHFYAKLAWIVVGALILLGVVFGIIVLFKYNRLFRHDLIEKYGHRFSASKIELIAWIIIFLPVLIFFGPIWLAPFWLMLFWGYGRRSEKFLSLFFLLMFALAYPVYHATARVSRVSADQSISTYISAFSEGGSPKSIADMEKYYDAHPDDTDGSIVLAYLYKNDQRTVTAIEVLQKHILEHPQDARAYNNLAAIYFQQGETDTALRLSQKAADLDARNAIYPYNLAKLQRAKFNFSEAERLMEVARRQDQDLIKKLDGTHHEKLLDSIPSHSLVVERIKQKNHNWQSFLANPFTAVAGGLFLFTFVFSVRKKDRGFARSCIKCGKPFCKKCQPSAKELRFCTQCLHIFVKKDGVSPVSRKEKMKEIESYSRKEDLLLRIFSLVLPGAGNLYRNRIMSGTILLFAWFLLLAVILFHWRFSGISFLEPSEGLKALGLVCILLMVVVYFLANIPLLRKSKA